MSELKLCGQLREKVIAELILWLAHPIHQAISYKCKGYLMVNANAQKNAHSLLK
jgi:hypothetical protein